MTAKTSIICDGCASDIEAQPTFLMLEHSRNHSVPSGRERGAPDEPLDERRHFCDNRCLANWLEKLGVSSS